MDLSEKPPRARYSRSSAAMPPITHAAYQTSDEHHKFPRARPQTTETYSPCLAGTGSCMFNLVYNSTANSQSPPFYNYRKYLFNEFTNNRQLVASKTSRLCKL